VQSVIQDIESIRLDVRRQSEAPRLGASCRTSLSRRAPAVTRKQSGYSPISFSTNSQVLQDAPPLWGEEARYADVLALAKTVQQDPKLKAAVIDERPRPKSN